MDDVVVVGSGPTGLALAAELLRRGRTFRLLDAGLTPSSRSKATVVSPRTLEVLDAHGLADRALAMGRLISALRCYGDGRLLTELPADRGTATRFPFPLVLPQRDTERLLLDRLAAGGVEPERGRRVTAVRQDAEHVVATVEGPTGCAEIECRWLVGCDGVHSLVRSELGVPFPGRRLPETFLVAEVEADTGLPDDRGHFFLSGAGVVVFVALPTAGDGRPMSRLTIDLPRPLPGEPTLETIQQELDRRGAGDIRLRALDWVSSFRIASRVAARFRAGRVLLAGDAAHVHSPVGGQGMNTAIQDAVNLGWKLDLTVTGAADPGLLDSYPAERIPVARALVRQTELLSRAGVLRGPVAALARAAVIRGAARTGATARLGRRLTQLDLGYPDSPVVAPPVTGPAADGLVRPGSRAPDGTLHSADGGEVPLHRVLAGGGHSLLVFSADPLPAVAGTLRVHRVVRAPAGPPVPGVLTDRDGSVHRAYGVHREAAVLVRPDGYVAAADPGADAGARERVLSWLPRPPTGDG